MNPHRSIKGALLLFCPVSVLAEGRCEHGAENMPANESSGDSRHLHPSDRIL